MTVYEDSVTKPLYTQTVKFRSGAVSTSQYEGYQYVHRSGVARPKPKGLAPGGGFVAPTAYRVENTLHFHPPVEWKTRGHPTQLSVTGQPAAIRGTGEGTLRADANGWFGEDGFGEANLRNGLITEARLKVKDQSVNWAQAWAERRMTANLLADSISRIANSLIALRRGEWRQAWRWLKRNWKHAPNSWLEYQYGWKPLIQDVMGSVEALQKLTDPADWKVSVKCGRSIERDYYKQLTTASSNIGYTMDFRGRRKAGGFIRFDFKPSAYFLSNIETSTGITNPLQLQWELIPFSFVLDWGVQVGDWLSSLDATKHMEFLGGSYSLRKELVVTGTPRSTSTVPGTYGSDPSAGVATNLYRRFILDRQVYSAWPVASLPRFKDPLSMTHVANALSLLAVSLRGGRPRVK